MSVLNNKETKKRIKQNKVAGGYGKTAAEEDSFNKLKRLMQLAVIGEERYYPEEEDISTDIIRYAQKTAKEVPDKLISLIEFTRNEIGLRHSPMYALLGILKENPQLLKKINPSFFLRPVDTMDMVALFFQKNETAKTLPKQLKKIIEKALNQYDLYQFSKYGKYRKNLQINLVDVFNLVHPKPINEKQNELFKRVVKQDLPPAETWEYFLSTSQLDKKEAWEYLIRNNKLPVLATIRNIRNMLKANVDEYLIADYINQLSFKRVFPAQILSAIIYNNSFVIKEALMSKLKVQNEDSPLKGKTLIILDTSGSMGDFVLNVNFLHSYAFRAVSVLFSLAANSEDFDVVLTAGDDYSQKHKSIFLKDREKELIKNGRIEELLRIINNAENIIGWGGIFTHQVLSWVKKQNKEKYDRVVIISDSQDMDQKVKNEPLPSLSSYQYINNIAAYKKVGYNTHIDESGENEWQEITTYSSKLVDYIVLSEKNF